MSHFTWWEQRGGGRGGGGGEGGEGRGGRGGVGDLALWYYGPHKSISFIQTKIRQHFAFLMYSG